MSRPNLLNTSIAAEIRLRIEGLSEGSHRRWGSMSVGQMVVHCTDQIRMALGQKEVHEAPTFINRNIAKYVGLWLPRIPFRNMKSPVDMHPAHYGTVPTELDADKLLLLELIDQYLQTPVNAVLPPHSMFGKPNREQWGRFMFVHLDHHLRQFSS